MIDVFQPISGQAAGVPFVALPPIREERSSAPVVVSWHLMDAPRTETAFAAAVPLSGLDAWRIYLGLPLCGSRLPAGGWDEVMRLGYEDAVLKLIVPVIDQAADEFGEAIADLRSRLQLREGPIGVMGGSTGAAVAQLILASDEFEVNSAVLISPIVQLRTAVEATGRRFGITYPWSAESNQAAARLDFIARASEIISKQPAVLLIVGEEDDLGIRESAAGLQMELELQYEDKNRAQVAQVPGMEHALADEPGMDPAPQTSQAAEVDSLAVGWLQRYLGS
jgi:dienelactone hydrolase